MSLSIRSHSGGLTLEELAKDPTSHGHLVPALVRACVEYIEQDGLTTEGLYRIPGNRAHVEQLVETLRYGIISPSSDLLSNNRSFVVYRVVIKSYRSSGCVCIEMSTSSALSGYPSCISMAWLIGASLVQVECLRSLVHEHNSTPVVHIE